MFENTSARRNGQNNHGDLNRWIDIAMDKSYEIKKMQN